MELAASPPGRLVRIGRAVLDLILPPRCLGCGVEVRGVGSLCPTCWAGLRFLTPPWCRICGYPLPHAVPEAPLDVPDAGLDATSVREHLDRQRQEASVPVQPTRSPVSHGVRAHRGRHMLPTPHRPRRSRRVPRRTRP